jgi:hypothetical protein
MGKFYLTLACIILAVAASAGELKFIRGQGPERKIDDAAVSTGTFDGHKAWQFISAQKEYTTYVELDKAKTWNDARAACRLLSPKDGWDLPDPGQTAISVMFLNGATDIAMPNKHIYLLWARTPNDAGDQEFKGTDKLASFADGEGMDSYAVSLSEILSNMNSAPAQYKSVAAKIKDSLKDGIAIRCASSTVR